MYSQFKKVCENGTYVLLSAVENECLIGSVMGVICEELYGSCNPFMVLENMIVDKKPWGKTWGTGILFLKNAEPVPLFYPCFKKLWNVNQACDCICT